MATNKGTGRLATGRFPTRSDLTCHVWSMYRQQVFPNVRAIAGACGVTMQVVRAVVDNKEGLSEYLERGCLTGIPAVAVRR